MNEEDGRPFEWWEEIQVNLILRLVSREAPHLIPDAEEMCKNPAKWRAFREELKKRQSDTTEKT